MQVSAPQSPVRDVYGRMRRISEAIDDPDSSVGQRGRWTKEYIELSGELAGAIGARAAGGAELLDRVTSNPGAPDGRTPRVPPPADGRTDVYL